MTILDQIAHTFESNGWAFHRVDEAAVIEAGFEAHHGRVHLHVQAYEPLRACSVVSVSPVTQTDPDRRVKTVELLMHANQRLNLGGFEMRWEQGETLFRIGNLFPEQGIDSRILTTMVEVAIVEMDRITPCLSLIGAASPMDLLTLQPEALLQREDLVPEVPAPAEDQ